MKTNQNAKVLPASTRQVVKKNYKNILLTSMMFSEISHGTTNYAVVFIYAYVGSWFATLIVDLTLGTLLGLDITYLGQLMVSTFIN